MILYEIRLSMSSLDFQSISWTPVRVSQYLLQHFLLYPQLQFHPATCCIEKKLRKRY
ncbi:hypothetical protein GW17_00022862 [Ensete ventricosum]|nr:hypothetical protein GW17_00022862 [Ensete ventricosum]RZS12295.1 hypothetical protein BHM03_00043743 [Ensete ventricosum]